MRCFCCSHLLPTDSTPFYDLRVDRFYCFTCDLYIEEYTLMLSDPTLKKEDGIEDASKPFHGDRIIEDEEVLPGEEPMLDEGYDYDYDDRDFDYEPLEDEDFYDPRDE